MKSVNGTRKVFCRTMRRPGARCLSALAAVLLAGCVTTTEPEKDYETKVSEVVLAAAIDAERSYDYATAARHFETLHEREPTSPNVIRDLARNLRYAGSPAQAVSALKRSIKSFGQNPILVLELAKAQLAVPELDDAHETLTNAETIETLAGDWQYHLVFGIYHDRTGNFVQAQESYERALALSPGNIAVLNNLGLSYALAGDIDRGIETLRKLADSERTTSLTRQNLALLYGVKGDMDAAGQMAKKDLPGDMVDGNLKTYRGFHE